MNKTCEYGPEEIERIADFEWHDSVLYSIEYVDPCTVTVETAHPGHWQVWKCHAKCFKDRLAKSDDYCMFDPAHF